MLLPLLAGLLFTSQSCYSLLNCSNNSVEVKCTEIVAFFQSESNYTLSVSTRQFDCCTGSTGCGNSSLPKYNESCDNLPSINITVCNSFTNTTSNCSCLTSETSETHIASSETPSNCLPIVSNQTHTTLSENLSSFPPIVSYQTVSTNSPNVFEATYSIFVVAILLILGTNIAFCIAFCIIKRNQLKKVLQVQQVERLSLNQDNQLENQIENQLNERNKVSNSEDDKTDSSIPYREPNESPPPLKIAYSDLVSENPYILSDDENEPTTTSHQETTALYSVLSRTQSQTDK